MLKKRKLVRMEIQVIFKTLRADTMLPETVETSVLLAFPQRDIV